MIINYSEKKCFHKISELNTVLGDQTDTRFLFFSDPWIGKEAL
jgi:hypothetical protein